MATINMPRRPKDQLTAISQALGLANALYGLGTKSEQLDLLRDQVAQSEKAADPKSEMSQLARQRAEGLGLEITPTTTAAQVEKQFGTGADLTKLELAQRERERIIAKDEAKLKREEQKTKVASADKLRTKVERIDRDFQPMERLYGSIDALKDKFNKGTLNPQDRVQLVRLLVPLTELNPGVVRGEEVDLVRQQQSSLDQIQNFFNQKIKGESINDTVIRDMFDTADSLKPVVSNQKFDRISDIAANAERKGVTDQLKFILGKKNERLLGQGAGQGVATFAQFGEPVVLGTRGQRKRALADNQKKKPKLSQSAIDLLKNANLEEINAEIERRSTAGR